MQRVSDRRCFLQQSGAGVAAALMSGVWSSRSVAESRSPNEKLSVAFIGTDGHANLHLRTIAALGHHCPCFCDVDSERLKPAVERWPAAARYQDYRRMMDERHDEIDAVFVTTPDHHHFPASMIAVQHGKHVYCEKPLTHSVWEARELARAARRNGVATQMGIQGHARRKWRELITLVRAGRIGSVREVHAWSDRPVWPQGIDRPQDAPNVPASLDWDVWLGPAPVRPYHPAYHPFKWRGWCDFGTAALGDMACHQLDGMWWLLDPGAPARVEVVAASRGGRETFPQRSVVRWEFPAKLDRANFSLTWYDGGLFPPRPAELPSGEELPTSGCYFAGEQGSIVVAHAGDDPPQVLAGPESRADRLPDEELAISPSPGHHQEFIDAAKGGPPAEANFDYSGPLTEAILLGVLALRVGKPIEWDASSLVARGLPEAEELIRRPYRKGWEVVG